MTGRDAALAAADAAPRVQRRPGMFGWLACAVTRRHRWRWIPRPWWDGWMLGCARCGEEWGLPS